MESGFQWNMFLNCRTMLQIPPAPQWSRAGQFPQVTDREASPIGIQ
jgi:hypothetical protein